MQGLKKYQVQDGGFFQKNKRDMELRMGTQESAINICHIFILKKKIRRHRIIKPCLSGCKYDNKSGNPGIAPNTQWPFTKCSSSDFPSSPISSRSRSLSLRPVVCLKQSEKLVKWKQKGTRSSQSRLQHQACHQVSVCP